MNPTPDYFVDLLSKKTLSWSKVVGYICIVAEYDKYGIKLCSYKHDGNPAISLNVDNLKTGEMDFIYIQYFYPSEEYKSLKQLYDNALTVSKNIQSGSFVV